MSAAEPVLEVRGVTMRFGGLKALAAFDLALRPGELVGLIGPNGAGKTTAFNAITGVYVPTEGEVRVAGALVNGRRPHEICARGVARTFQNIRLFKELTALDNVRIACHAGARSGFFDALLLLVLMLLRPQGIFGTRELWDLRLFRRLPRPRTLAPTPGGASPTEVRDEGGRGGQA